MPTGGIKKLVTDIIFDGDVVSVLTKPSHSLQHTNTRTQWKKTAPNQSRTNFYSLISRRRRRVERAAEAAGVLLKKIHISKFVCVRFGGETLTQECKHHR
jgi:hypothetical protein